MKSQAFCAAVALFATVAYLQGAEGTKITRDFSELTSVERTILRLTRPEVYKTWSSGSNNEKIPESTLFQSSYVFLYFDLPMLSLQLRKSGNILLPNLHVEIGYDWCWIRCTGFGDTFDWIEPVIKNANLTQFTTKINATNVEIDFKIPDLRFISEKYYQRSEDLDSGDVTEYRGASLSITNYTFQLSADLKFVPNIGLQVSNVAMNFAVEAFRERRDNATHTFPDGRLEDLGPVETQYGDQLNADWADVGSLFTYGAEIWLNCFLSTGRNGQDECNDLIGDRMQTENFGQLLQAIGFEIVQNQEELAKSSISEAENNKLLPLFLPQFPFPSMKSILLDLPALLLQIGKFAAYVENNYLVMDYFPLSYDFIRENCSVGECRKIHENMTLNQYGIGGFADNQPDLNIEPTNFTYFLKVPKVYMNAEGFQHETTDVETRFREVYLGLNLTIIDAAFAISGDYELKEDVGLQVSNLSLTHLLGELQMRVPQYFTINNGEESEIVEYKVDIAPQIIDTWRAVDEDGVSFERKYEDFIENAINAHLWPISPEIDRLKVDLTPVEEQTIGVTITKYRFLDSSIKIVVIKEGDLRMYTTADEIENDLLF